jgi:hypothetical protein
MATGAVTSKRHHWPSSSAAGQVEHRLAPSVVAPPLRLANQGVAGDGAHPLAAAAVPQGQWGFVVHLRCPSGRRNIAVAGLCAGSGHAAWRTPSLCLEKFWICPSGRSNQRAGRLVAYARSRSFKPAQHPLGDDQILLQQVGEQCRLIRLVAENSGQLQVAPT